MKRVLIIILFCSCFFSVVFAEELEIKVNQKSIKLPYWSAQNRNYGGIIIVRGGDPVVWSESLASLSQLLAKNGWSTVLLNCLPGAGVPWLTQLPEAISVLRQNKNKRIILIHYGEQLNMALEYFSKPQGKTVNGLVLLSAYDMKASELKPATLNFPIFDIDGQFDYENVQSQWAERAKTFKSPTYSSMQIPGADHDYDYARRSLVSFIVGWMLKIPESTVSAPPINSKSLVQQSYIEPISALESHLVAINDVWLRRAKKYLEPLAQ